LGAILALLSPREAVAENLLPALLMFKHDRSAAGGARSLEGRTLPSIVPDLIDFATDTDEV
jgi:hypothetical protein